MSVFPLRLILSAYGGAAILAGLSWVTGGTLIGAGLLFWFGGSCGLFVLPALSSRFRDPEAEAEAAASLERLNLEYAQWAADLSAEEDALAARSPVGLRQAG